MCYFGCGRNARTPPTSDQNEVGGDTGGLIVLQANDGCDERPDPLGGGLDVVVCEIVVQRPTLTPLDPVKSISYGADRRAIYAPINSLCRRRAVAAGL